MILPYPMVRKDWSFYTLVAHPSEVGSYNLQLAFHAQTLIPFYRRVIHFTVGFLMIWPILNTITYLALRTFSLFHKDNYKNGVQFDTSPTGIFKTQDKQQKNIIDLFNTKRDSLKEKWQKLKTEEKKFEDQKNLTEEQCALIAKKNGIYDQILEIEKKASHEVSIEFESSSNNHLTRDFTSCDSNTLSQFLNFSQSYQCGLTLNELPALLQIDANNELCGYYALFFLWMAASEGDLMDRKKFLDVLPEWMDIIAKKRITAWLNTQEKIPYSIQNTSVKGLSPEDIKLIINSSPELQSLRKYPCYFMTLENTDNPLISPYAFSYYIIPYRIENFNHKPVMFLGENSNDLEKGVCPSVAYCILQSKSHYYLLVVRENRLTVAHSLSTPIKQILSEEHVEEIYSYLTEYGLINTEEAGKGKSKQNLPPDSD